MFGDNDEIEMAAAEFAGTFGLRGFPGHWFFVNVSKSYVSRGTIQLYVFDENDRPFSKATPDELRKEIVGRIE